MRIAQCDFGQLACDDIKSGRICYFTVWRDGEIRMLKRILSRTLPFGRKYRAQCRLAASLKPDPEYLVRHKANSERAKKGWRSRRHDFLNDPLVQAVIASKPVVIHSGKKAAFRSLIYLRDGAKCCHCGGYLQIHDNSQTKTYGTLEHLHPRFLGGSWSVDNLALAHERCNQNAASSFNYVAENARKIVARIIASRAELRGK